MKTPIRALPEVIKNFFSKPATVKYPAVKAEVFDAFRGRIVFEQEKCIGCNMCVRVCPAKAIKIIPSETAKPAVAKPAMSDKPETPAKRIFDCLMDLTHCIYCAQCVDTCPKDALASTHDFELAQLNKTKLELHYK